MLTAFLGDHIAHLLVTFLAFILLPSILVSLLIHVISVKYKFKINFKFNRLHQLADIEILKLSNETHRLHIQIRKIWISSCYLNRQVNSRILVTLSDVRLNYYSSTPDLADPSQQPSTGFFFVYWLIQFYLKYIGSLCVNSCSLKLIDILKICTETSLDLKQLTLEFKDNTQSNDNNQSLLYTTYSSQDYLKFSCLDLNFKLLKISNNFTDLLSELNINKTTLNVFTKVIDLNYLAYRSKYQAVYLNTVERVQLSLDNSYCILNKLIALDEKSYFRDFKFFIEYLNTPVNTNVISVNDETNLVKVLSKIQLVEVKNWQSKFILDTKYEKIRLDELKYMNNSILDETAIAKTEQLIEFFVKRIDFCTDIQQKYSLLSRFSVNLERTRDNQYSLTTCCESANIYVHISFIKSLLYSKFFDTLIVNSNQKRDENRNINRRAGDLLKKLLRVQNGRSSNDKVFVFNFQMVNSYVHFVYTDVSSPKRAAEPTNKSTHLSKPASHNSKAKYLRAVYSLGTSHLHIKLAQSGHENLVSVDIKRPVLFKSNVSSTNNSKLFVNNLFERPNVSLNNLLAFINNEHQKSRHYWGNLLSLNNLKLKLKTNQWRTSTSILIDSCNLEHSVDAITLIDFLISFYNDKFPFGLECAPNSTGNDFVSSFQLKVSVKSFSFFLPFRQQYLLVLQLGNFDFIRNKKNFTTDPSLSDTDNTGFNLTISTLACVQFNITEHPNIFQQQTAEESIILPPDLSNMDIFHEATQPIRVIKSTQHLSYCIIENLLDTKDLLSNYNLILLINTVHFNTCIRNGVQSDPHSFYEYSCLTIKHILCTWSLQIHYILYQSLVKPIVEFRSKLSNRFIHYDNESENLKPPVKFKLNILIESDVLINFLFDYSQDSSKSDLIDSVSPYQTISIILYDTFFTSINNMTDLKLHIADVSAFVNADDQNIIETNQNSPITHITTNQPDHSHFTNTFTCNNGTDHHFQQPSKRQFLNIKNIMVTLLQDDSTLEYERDWLKTTARLNTLLSLNSDLFKINFIHDYNFAKLIDHILNLKKCLLLIHSIEKRIDVNIESPLTWDILIKIAKFQLTIEDDPFEIRLAYNYALMQDEHLESVKRRKQLEQRRLFKDKQLEKEAIEMLNEREATIYMQRSKSVYNPIQNRSLRQELFTFTMENIDLFVLSDWAWHGRKRCYELLRKIDQDSPPPPASDDPAGHYHILWCRYIDLKTSEFKFVFRDYTQPFLKMTGLHLFGHVIGGEYEAHMRAKRNVKVGLGLNDELAVLDIVRNMSPFKVYHDVCSKMGSFCCAYGPCWEGSMAQLNLCLDKIIHPARDPSRPMPWWDKSRLYLHGRFTAQIQHTQLIYHVSMDPYNRTEEMKWVFSHLYFDWTNMLMLFKGSLDIYLNTESKYDDCRLLHLPNLELKICIEWICKQHFLSGQESPKHDINLANLHNFVIPCAPDKLPVIINSSEHDSYAQFRSENLNISLSFVTKLMDVTDRTGDQHFESVDKKQGEQNATILVPTCKFYASTSRFLERIKTLLSTITRPTKRGKLFNNFKPRKPLLSRHFKQVHIHFDIPKLMINYWSSASEEYGCLLKCQRFTLDSSHRLELIPFLDSLKRRPRPCWNIELMKCQLAQTTIYLLAPNSPAPKSNQPTSAGSSGQMNSLANDIINLNSGKFLENNPGMQSFFMQIDSVFYERQKTAINYSTMAHNRNESKVINPEAPPVIKLKRFSTKRLKSNQKNNHESSTSSSDAQAINSKQKRSSQYNQRYHSVKQTSNNNEAYMRFSLRVKKPTANDYVADYRPKSHSLLLPGGQLYQRNPDAGIGSSESVIQPNTGATTLTNVSLNSLILPFRQHHQQHHNVEMPKHVVQVRNLKAKWDNVNRDVIYILYEIYNKAKRLRHNLSTHALKTYDVLTDQIVQNFATTNGGLAMNGQSMQGLAYLNRNVPDTIQCHPNPSPATTNSTANTLSNSKTTRQHSNQQNQSISKNSAKQKTSSDPVSADPQIQFFEDLLQKLDTERDHNSEVYCDERPVVDHANSNYNLLYGVHASSRMADVLNENIFIEFINSQVKLSLEDDPNKQVSNNNNNVPSTASRPTVQKANLKNAKKSNNFQSGESTYDSHKNNEYLIISAAKANVIQRVHKPVWKSQRLLDKTSWSGNLETMQYFATLNYFNPTASFTDQTTQVETGGEEYWLTDDIIDIPIVSPSCSPQVQSPNVIHKFRTSMNGESVSINSSGPSMINDDITSSSSSNYLTKVNKKRNRLGMLITYNQNLDRGSVPKFEKPVQSTNETPVQQPLTKQPKQRFKNIRNGLTRSNRKLRKPDISTNATNPLNTQNSFDQLRPKHLQLIVSKCRCEFYMIDFEDKIGDDEENVSAQLKSNSHLITPEFYSQIFSQNSTQANINNQKQPTETASNQQIDLNATFNEPMDCISLIHHDLDLCTTSDQYKMIMSLVNNLVLYFRPRRKQIMDKQKSIKFNLQLSSSGDLDSLVRHIKLKQIECKELLCNIRALERQLYHLREKIQTDMNDYSAKYGAENFQNAHIYAIQELKLENKSMEKVYREFKRQLIELSDELNIAISCYKELMLEKRAFNLANAPQFVQHVLTNIIPLEQQFLAASSPSQSIFYHNINTSNLYLSKLINHGIQQTYFIDKAKGESSNSKSVVDLDQQAQQSILNNEIGRRYEIWFKQTKWQLNDDDGQSGCAQFLMKNILYTKVSNQQELDCVEHTLEIESCKVQDLTELAKPSAKSSKRSYFVLKGLFDNGFSFASTTNGEEFTNCAEPTDYSADLTNRSGTMIRVYFKERPPVGCIPVIDHLELNVSPLSINLTNSFYKMAIKFFLDKQTANQINTNQGSNTGSSSSNLGGGPIVSSVVSNQLQIPNNSNNSNNMTRIANSTLRRNYQSFQGFSNEDYGGNEVVNSQIHIALNSPGNFQHLNRPNVGESSSLKASNSMIMNNNNILIIDQQQLDSSDNQLDQTSENNIIVGGNSTPAVTANSTKNQLKNDDIEIMKQRSANNCVFLCIKIPEIQLLVSYRATEKDKNIKNLKNVRLLFPLFEAHDKTWTWLDLINALKSHVKKALVSQALRHKLIKVPIQPVNKLLNRVGRSHSSQHLTNLEIDENEKLTILKLFGTKFIEKNSAVNPSLISHISIGLNQNEEDSLNNSADFHGEHDEIDNSSNKSMLLAPFKKSSSVRIHKKAPVAKSNSSVGFNLKKRLFKLGTNSNRDNLDSTTDKMKLARQTSNIE